MPFSVFPSTYKNDTTATQTDVKVDEKIKLSTSGREGNESRFESYSRREGPRKDSRYEENVKVYEEDRYRRPVRREEEVRVYEEDRREDR